MTDLAAIELLIDTCDRVRPHLRDLADVAALDARRAQYVAELDAAKTAQAVTA